jgi:DNA invertase Pin-like site-specific DNA recombinase
MIYGYCRVSTPKQRLDRQVSNIKAAAQNAVIVQEAYTGTSMERPAWSKLMTVIRPGDTVIFDEVSRMSRDAEEGVRVYQELYDKGVSLVFLKEPFINTSTYKDVAKAPETGDRDLDETIIKGLNEYLMRLARKQIQIAFAQAQAEVDHLHQRTSEGVRKAQERFQKEEALGLDHEKKAPGRQTGTKLTTKRSIEAKEQIRKYSRNFDGNLTDKDVITLTGLARNSFYKYKREMMEAAADGFLGKAAEEG